MTPHATGAAALSLSIAVSLSSCKEAANTPQDAALLQPVASASASAAPKVELPPSSASAHSDAAEVARTLDIQPRQAWGARKSIEGRMRKNASIRWVTIHHTAERNRANSRASDVLRGIQTLHVETKKWGDVAYHYFIAPTGIIYEGRDPRFTADTATEYDPAGHITISMLGNFESEQATTEAKSSMVNLIANLLSSHRLTANDVRAHRDVAHTLCPGKLLTAYLAKEAQTDIASALKSPSILRVVSNVAP